MMSVQVCASHGVTDLMVVHDSFSTTIADASTMSWAIREAFVQLYYDYCLFSDIKEQVLAMLDQPELADLPDIPYKGSLDIEAVLPERLRLQLIPFTAGPELWTTFVQRPPLGGFFDSVPNSEWRSG